MNPKSLSSNRKGKPMELREFINIFVVRKRLFFAVFLAFVFAAFAGYRFQPMRYETSLTLNISRTGFDRTDAYRYDQFYRLQADERFADTVVRWIASPSVRSEMRSLGMPASVSDSIVAKRLSSQMIDVRYAAPSVKGFGNADDAVVSALNRETERLNEGTKDPSWFVIIADDPVVSDSRIPFRIMFGGGVAAGIFFAFWTVLFARYFEKGKKPDNH